LRSAHQLRRLDVDLASRMKSPQVRDVAVIVLRIIDVFEPFLELAVAADLIRRNAATDFGPLPALRLVDS
jgi:hypothetical protein